LAFCRQAGAFLQARFAGVCGKGLEVARRYADLMSRLPTDSEA
jgi:hypothetical protein